MKKTDMWKERKWDMLRRKSKQGQGEEEQVGLLSGLHTNFSGIYIICQALF